MRTAANLQLTSGLNEMTNNTDMPAYAVGDKVFNTNYLPYIGNSSKFLKINMKPILTVRSVGSCRPYLTKELCFSAVFNDLSSAIEAPCNYSRIFYQETGLDVDRGQDKLLCFRSNYDGIQSVIDNDVQAKVDKSRKDMNKVISDLQYKILQARNDHDAYVSLCNDHAYTLLTELEQTK